MKEAKENERRDLIYHAINDQINAVSELTLTLLKNELPLQPQHVILLKPYCKQIRNLGKKSMSQKVAQHFTQSAWKRISQSA